MPPSSYTLKSSITVYPGMAAWRFLTLPKKQAEEIKAKHAPAKKRGWGSIPVTVTIGKTSWNTSIFPDKKSGSYLLPLKHAVRKQERITDKAIVRFTVVIR